MQSLYPGRILIIPFFFLLLLVSCKKQDEWLDIKSTKSDIIPKTIENFQAYLDNDDVMNSNQPTLAAVGSDNYYVPYTSWLNKTGVERNAYMWADNIYADGIPNPSDFSILYKKILFANIALEGISQIKLTSLNEVAWKNVKGSALFFRAYAFYNAVALWAEPYDEATASGLLGIPLRTSTDVNERFPRATLQDTYDRIITDLEEAITLLPEAPLYQTRPSKIAAQALLARIYLSMREYVKAGELAEKVLGANSFLMNFNDLSTTATAPFPAFPGNKEVIFYSHCINYGIVGVRNDAIVDSSLYSSYLQNDLRRSILYRDDGGGVRKFKGTYAGSLARLFDGLAVNEMYFIKAESQVRNGSYLAGLATLDSVLKKRWNKNAIFVPSGASSQQQALTIILQERRKELPFTSNLRWTDLRRLNKDPYYKKSLVRKLDGHTYTLQPEDKRYVLFFPPDEILFNGIEQNPR